MKEYTCNKCHNNMDYHVESKKIDEIIASVCTNTACPNYALLQMAREQMPTTERDSIKKARQQVKDGNTYTPHTPLSLSKPEL